MRVDLFPFQKKAVDRLHQNLLECKNAYERLQVPQVISFTAPTGAGKTIIMAALIEEIYRGNAFYADEGQAIIVWLSDSPELNLQSKLKMERLADLINMRQLVIVNESSFDKEMLEDGKIYFLNTQKLSASSKLTHQGDGRTFTIWQTLANTVEEKGTHLYIIIDEAHRGMLGNREAAGATTIMQKFLKGSSIDQLPPMPIVIGMSATTARFNRLVEKTNSTIYQVAVSTDEVRASGLLKDRIVITYPDKHEGNYDMAVLQAATDNWMEKWDHWQQYCTNMHYKQVNPVFVIQVQNGTGSALSDTDLNDCLAKIEDRAGYHFSKGQVVRTFGETSQTLLFNGLEIPYIEPSRIADNREIRVVFFKENLSTGWDCPRAETMMSFRHAKDATYIAQLLGRMVRTPLQQHIEVDDTLNDVHLYLPYFDAGAVKSVVDDLQREEGSQIPADIWGETMENPRNIVLTADTLPFKQADSLSQNHEADKKQEAQQSEQPSYSQGSSIKFTIKGSHFQQDAPISMPSAMKEMQEGNLFSWQQNIEESQSEQKTGENARVKEIKNQSAVASPSPEQKRSQTINRSEVVQFLNRAGLLTYKVQTIAIKDYLSSLLALCHLLTQNELNKFAVRNTQKHIVNMIHEYNEKLKQSGEYGKLAEKVKQFRMKTEVFDVYGEKPQTQTEESLLVATDADVERQFSMADQKLGNDGINKAYGREYYDLYHPLEFKIDVILYANNEACIEKLRHWAKDEFHKLADQYRRPITGQPERVQKQYNTIVSNGDIISKHNFKVPVRIEAPNDIKGKLYYTHLYVNPETGAAPLRLNSWESGIIEEESKRNDYVCFIRNPSRASWGLCIPYEKDGKSKGTYPDFIVIRRDDFGYVADILEPHRADLDDNLPKAKGFAHYAGENPGVGRIELIRQVHDNLSGRDRFCRLDLTKLGTREKVLRAISNEELTRIFESDGFYDN